MFKCPKCGSMSFNLIALLTFGLIHVRCKACGTDSMASNMHNHRPENLRQPVKHFPKAGGKS